jgi:hypothetical protein
MTRGTAVVAWVMLCAAGAPAGADVLLRTAGESVVLSSPDTSVAFARIKAPGLPWTGWDVLPNGPQAAKVVGISHSDAGAAVHTMVPGGAVLTTALFHAAGPGVPGAPFVLRDPRTGATTLPGALRTVSLGPGGTTLVHADHVVLSTGAPWGVLLVREPSSAIVLVTFDFAGGTVRRAPLGITAPLGSTKGSVVATGTGGVWLAVASATGVRSFYIDETGILFLALQEATQMESRRFLTVANPRSVHLGIIAVLIGLAAEPVPTLSLQEGDELKLFVLEGDEFRLAAQQALPPAASGLMAEDGIFYFFLDQGVVWRGVVGQAPEAALPLGR